MLYNQAYAATTFVDSKDVSTEESFPQDLTFNSDGTFMAMQPANIDDPMGTGVWEFATDEKSVIFDKGLDKEMTVTIVSMTPTMLTTIMTQEDWGNIPVTMMWMH